MNITIKINTDNTAFEDNQDELQLMVTRIGNILDQPNYLRDPQRTHLYDSNDYLVGFVEVINSE